MADNLQGLALARSDEKQRQYRDDATVLQSFIANVSGGDPADEYGGDFEAADTGLCACADILKLSLLESRR